MTTATPVELTNIVIDKCTRLALRAARARARLKAKGKVNVPSYTRVLSLPIERDWRVIDHLQSVDTICKLLPDGATPRTRPAIQRAITRLTALLETP